MIPALPPAKRNGECSRAEGCTSSAPRAGAHGGRGPHTDKRAAGQQTSIPSHPWPAAADTSPCVLRSRRWKAHSREAKRLGAPSVTPLPASYPTRSASTCGCSSSIALRSASSLWSVPISRSSAWRRRHSDRNSSASGHHVRRPGVAVAHQRGQGRSPVSRLVVQVSRVFAPSPRPCSTSPDPGSERVQRDVRIELDNFARSPVLRPVVQFLKTMNQGLCAVTGVEARVESRRPSSRSCCRGTSPSS